MIIQGEILVFKFNVASAMFIGEIPKSTLVSVIFQMMETKQNINALILYHLFVSSEEHKNMVKVLLYKAQGE